MFVKLCEAYLNNCNFYRDLSLSASGSYLPPLLYLPGECDMPIPLDLLEATARKNPETNQIEHCFLFGIPGVEDGIFTYRGDITACTEVVNILHSGKFKIGYK